MRISLSLAEFVTGYSLLPPSSPPRGGRYSVETAASLLASCLPCELAQEQGIGQFSPEALAAARASFADTPPSPPEAPPAASPAATGSEAPPPTSGPPEGAPPTPLAWTAVAGVEGLLTGDGRMIAANSLRWEEPFPQPLRYVPTDESMGHAGALVVGTIDGYTRVGTQILSTGSYDLATPIGREAARQAGTRQAPGVSMDLDDVSFEIRVAADLLAEMDTSMEELFEDDLTPPARPAPDSDGRVTVVTVSSDDEVMVTTSARIRALTQVAIPAFSSAMITLDAPDWADQLAAAEAYYNSPASPPAPALAASAASAAPIPVDPPSSWFDPPGFAAVTPLTVLESGRVYGHLATWGTCHLADPAGPGQCITPPSSPSGYALFLTGSVLTAEGSLVRVGQITMDTLHANRNASAAATIAHYESTGLAVADIAVGEDSFGIWFAGALRPHITPEQVRALRASPLSGDWRRPGGGRGSLELVAAMAVNVQGYPVPRPSGLVASGTMVSLVASGMVPPARVLPPGAPGALSLEDLRYLKRLAVRERNADQDARASAATFLRRIQAADLINRITAPARV